MRLIKWGILLSAATLFFFTVLTFASIFTSEDLLPPEQTDYVIVLSGPGAETQERTAAGVELYFKVSVMGGLVLSGGNGAAEEMRLQALAAGVADPAILAENQSRSTLQNALFVRDLGINTNARILLVTHRYHWVRARQSFLWAGFKTVHVQFADADVPPKITRHVFAEAIKWPVNIIRAAFASTMMSLDVPRDRWIAWLN